ncbi:MAG: hypothetical protein KC910_35260, partial [Candidatus Eremiobacteraeota bacterium]|nr:hypothetical protein [Candidatus Eremiobacteraeota bacterium]
MKCDNRGIIVPTALFVAMFVLLLSTVLIASVSYNFSLSLGSIEATEFRYLSLGAANELLSDLNSGLELTTYTRDNPRRVTNGGRVVESWVEPIDDDTKTVLVVAQTFTPGQGKPEVVKRLAIFKEHTLARVYTNVTNTDKDSPDPIYFSELSEAGAWNRLPDLPRARYSDSGVLESKPGEVAGTIPYISGSPDGSLYIVYAPTLDGWDDRPSPAYFFGIPVVLPWGDFALNTMVNGGKQGLTVGDLVPVAQVLVGQVDDVTVSKGAVMYKFSHDDGEWTALPPVEEATLVNGEFAVDTGNYHVQGVAGPPAAYKGGVTVPMYRKGQDSIYEYTDESKQWSIHKPPGKDIMLLATDQGGTEYVQTGDLRQVGPKYLFDILIANLTQIYPNTRTSALHKLENGQWTPIKDPPARFYDKSGKLVDSPYRGSRGPTLGGMIGGDDGELFVVNRPSRAGLVDTVYKYSGGGWEAVPSPP